MYITKISHQRSKRPSCSSLSVDRRHMLTGTGSALRRTLTRRTSNANTNNKQIHEQRNAKWHFHQPILDSRAASPLTQNVTSITHVLLVPATNKLDAQQNIVPRPQGKMCCERGAAGTKRGQAMLEHISSRRQRIFVCIGTAHTLGSRMQSHQNLPKAI